MDGIVPIASIYILPLKYNRGVAMLVILGALLLKLIMDFLVLKLGGLTLLLPQSERNMGGPHQPIIKLWSRLWSNPQTFSYPCHYNLGFIEDETPKILKIEIILIPKISPIFFWGI